MRPLAEQLYRYWCVVLVFRFFLFFFFFFFLRPLPFSYFCIMILLFSFPFSPLYLTSVLLSHLYQCLGYVASSRCLLRYLSYVLVDFAHIASCSLLRYLCKRL